ncbi:sugar MFS transporter [Niabella aurantiaca]|uniref:sugar MFS transporter n=1 Tax=Niabella aurantiaca TaxID=379900 RepID=UPI00035E0252|nr:sugar MFS transporter [Niabella aurantiaca]
MSYLISAAMDPVKNSRHTWQIATIGGFFFIFGFITWVNGTLIPYLTIACELKEWQAYLVTFAFYISYTALAIPSSRVLQLTGMIKGMRIGLVVMAGGCLLFVPAAYTRYYPLFLIALFVVGAGLTILQTAVNPYITLIGSIDKAAQRMSIMGICNKFAGIIAPLIFGAILLKNADSLIVELQSMDAVEKKLRLDRLAKAVILPYLILSGSLLVTAFLIKYARLPEIRPSQLIGNSIISETKKSFLSYRSNFVFGFIAVFCTMGLEVIAGDTIANYGLYQGLSLNISKNLTAFTLASTLLGYLLGVILIPKIVSQQKAYLYSSVLGSGVVILAVVTSGRASVACVTLLGLTNALLWPAIWPQALRGLSNKTLNNVSAILIMGVAGGAVMPLMYTWLSHYTNNRVAYLILLPCYLFNLYYGTRGVRETSFKHKI